ncbi:MAG: DUF547 domain-containing protein [Nonlabens sp.]
MITHLRTALFSFVLIATSQVVNCQIDTFNKAADDLLQQYVQDGAVDYQALQTNGKSLSKAIDQMNSIHLEDLEENEVLPFYINAYNLLVIHQVLQSYPVASVMDVKDFFTDKNINFQGDTKSLNEIERDIFEKFPNDPRLHFVVVCGAVGCPQLSNRAFTKNNLRAKLKKLTRDAVNNPKLVELDMHEKKVHLSKIFEWYQSDFTKKNALLEFINYHRLQDIPNGFEVVYKEYDWSLNDLPR